MIEKEHRTRDDIFVEPGELAAKERQRARGIVRGTPTLPLPVIRHAADPAADAGLTGEEDAPRWG